MGDVAKQVSPLCPRFGTGCSPSHAECMDCAEDCRAIFELCRRQTAARQEAGAPEPAPASAKPEAEAAPVQAAPPSRQNVVSEADLLEAARAYWYTTKVSEQYGRLPQIAVVIGRLLEQGAYTMRGLWEATYRQIHGTMQSRHSDTCRSYVYHALYVMAACGLITKDKHGVIRLHPEVARVRRSVLLSECSV